jgi:hypothetical protein
LTKDRESPSTNARPGPQIPNSGAGLSRRQFLSPFVSIHPPTLSPNIAFACGHTAVDVCYLLHVARSVCLESALSGGSRFQPQAGRPPLRPVVIPSNCITSTRNAPARWRESERARERGDRNRIDDDATHQLADGVTCDQCAPPCTSTVERGPRATTLHGCAYVYDAGSARSGEGPGQPPVAAPDVGHVQPAINTIKNSLKECLNALELIVSG